MFNLKIATLLILLFSYKISAQNLIPNPSFEQINNCTLDFLDHPIEGFIQDWFTFDYQLNTVDVLHTCFNFPEIQPPNTVRGYSYPHIGNGMIGLGYVKEDNYREVASVRLNDSLIKDSAYCVSFWVKNSRIENMLYWVEYVGLLFSEDTVTTLIIQNENPDIKSNQDLSVNEWIEVSGYYIAKGNEKFANIGFFGPDIGKYQNIQFQPNTNLAPFYFFDDVTVTNCNKDSVLSIILKLPNFLTSNGDGINELYIIKHQNISSLQVQILNRWGNIIKEFDGLKDIWDGSDSQGNQLNCGVYFVKAIAETNFGDVIQKTQFVQVIID